MNESNKSDWATYFLGNLAECRRGITYTSTMLASARDGMPYINMKSFLKGGGFNAEGTKRYTGFYTPNDLVGERDLLLANTDVTSGDIVGVPALLPAELRAEKVLYSHHVTRLRLNGMVTTAFLYYLLCLPEYRSWMLKFARGTTVLMLDMDALKRIPVQVPRKTVQQNLITEILSTVDRTIEHTEELIVKYQRIKVGMMHDMFARGVAVDGRFLPTREEAPGLYKESPLGWIPKEWAVVTIEQCAAKAPGSTTIGPFGSDLLISDYRAEGAPVIFVRDIKEGSFEWNSNVYVTLEKARRLSAHAVKSGDLLITKMGLPPCLACAYPSGCPTGIVTADVIRLRPHVAGIDSRWLAAALNSDSFKRQVRSITAGVTRPKVTLSDFRKLLLARPSKEEQTRMADRLDSVSQILVNELLRLQNLQAQRLGLMHDLLTGRVPVNG